MLVHNRNRAGPTAVHRFSLRGGMIRLRTLGECLIEVDGTALSPESDVLFTVLLHLTAERDRRLSRGAVAELFWPDLSPKRARHCLRQVLYRLRALGLDVHAEHEH